MLLHEPTEDNELNRKINDVTENPTKHLHDYDGLFDCCMHNGMLNTKLLDAHPNQDRGQNGSEEKAT